MLKKNIFSLLCLCFGLQLAAQEDNSVYQFLRLPFSSHAAALGGENISVVEDDLNMAIHNPALLSYVSNNTLTLNYTLYTEGMNAASAAFSRLAGQRSSWAVTAQYIGYGSMKQTTPENQIIGTFTAKDIAIGGIYTYDLSDYWSGGVKANLIYSNYGHKSSFAIGVDLGVNYYLERADFSLSAVVRNLGGQIVTFNGKHEKLPVDLQIGFTQRLAHAPLRISATLYQLTDWKDKNFWKHLNIGLDFTPTDYLYVSLGYNFQRGKEMKIAGSSHWAGITAGTGLNIKKFKLGVTYGRYHIASSSFFFNLGYTL